MVARRQDLVEALSACTVSPHRAKARRFLLGLSADELQFIAEYLGSCILESSAGRGCSRAQLAERIAAFQLHRATRQARLATDRDHKMILLLEYLCRSGVPVRTQRLN